MRLLLFILAVLVFLPGCKKDDESADPTAADVVVSDVQASNDAMPSDSVKPLPEDAKMPVGEVQVDTPAPAEVIAPTDAKVDLQPKDVPAASDTASTDAPTIDVPLTDAPK